MQQGAKSATMPARNDATTALLKSKLCISAIPRLPWFSPALQQAQPLSTPPVSSHSIRHTTYCSTITSSCQGDTDIHPIIFTAYYTTYGNTPCKQQTVANTPAPTANTAIAKATIPGMDRLPPSLSIEASRIATSSG